MQDVLRNGNFIYLVCKDAHGLNIQRLLMELSVSHVCFLGGKLDKIPLTREPDH